MRQPAFRIEVPPDVRKRNQPGVALRGVQPVPHPWISGNIRLPMQPDIDPVSTVKQHRQKYGSPLHEQTEWNGLKFLRNRIVSIRADQRGAVRPEVFRQKRANGKYAGKGMKFSEEVIGCRLGRRRGHALSVAKFYSACCKTI